ncbi:sigma 54-interacting transcriptional regulator [Labilithrix luteola]|nr:sigma 54-interacting transcriptional regulator [Labilithrix luteola]
MQHDQTRSAMTRAADASSGLRLIVFCGGQVSSHPLPKSGELVLGRGEDAGIRIDHVTVSRRHASMLFGDEVRVVDHGSFNGTSIGGKKIAPNIAVPIYLATIVELGDVMLVLQVQGAAPVTGSQGVSNALRDGRAYSSPAMQHLHRLVDNVAQSNITVVVRGETGAGKEVIGEEIHRRSPRANGPLVKLNCAALPEQLLEGELFGYERGAFTGASQAKPGLIEAADGGTLFLDEVGELPLATQAKLLRVVESREVMRLGNLRPKTVDVRFVAATHRDLESMVASGAFRQDLYYRLNGVSLVVPPLRERPEEIPRLAGEFVARFCKDARRPVLPITEQAMAALRAYPWPGNVRELRNVIERAIVFCRGVALGPEHLGLPMDPPAMPPLVAPPPSYPPTSAWPYAATPSNRTALGMPGLPTMPPVPMPHAAYPASSYPPAPTPDFAAGQHVPPSSGSDFGTVAFGSSLPDEVEALERERILKVLAQCGGNQTQAAEVLGISRRTLLRRLDTYAVPRPRKP